MVVSGRRGDTKIQNGGKRIPPPPIEVGVSCANEMNMNIKSAITPEQSFFAVFCIESISDKLETTGDKVYIMLTEESDILDNYIIPHYDALHTQGKDYIVNELIELMKKQGVRI